ncbi:MAG: hypothetical protein ACOYLH_08255 [Flavobacteriales bacterium]
MRSVVVFLIGCLMLVASAVHGQNPFSKYPSPPAIYWLNQEYVLHPNTFKDKILVTYIWDLNDPVAVSYAQQLEAFVLTNQQIQLISIIKKDSTKAISVGDLKNFANEYGINHTVGITNTLEPFAADNAVLPMLVIHRNTEYYSQFNLSEFGRMEEVMLELKKLLKEGSTPPFAYWQIKPEAEWSNYADPLLESPSETVVDDDHSFIYVAENTKNRIAIYTQGGDLVDFVGGGKSGDVNASFRASRFGRVAGMAFDSRTDQVFFVDQTNNKVKAIETSSKIVYDFQTAAVGSYLRHPLDVEVQDTMLLVLDAASKSIHQYSIARFAHRGEIVLSGAFRSASEYPIKMVIKNNALLVLTNLGRIVSVENQVVSVLFDPPSASERPTALVVYKKKLYGFIAGKGLVRFENTGFEVVSDGGKRKFGAMMGLATGFGKILISDTGNNRMYLASAKGRKKEIVVKYDIEHVMMGDAMIFGEPVFYDVEIYGSGKNIIHLKLDLGVYKIYQEGRNEVLADERTGIVMDEAGVSNQGVDIIITEANDAYAQMELYLTVYDPADPNIIYYKRTILNFEYEVIPGEATEHEYEYTPKIRY